MVEEGKYSFELDEIYGTHGPYWESIYCFFHIYVVLMPTLAKYGAKKTYNLFGANRKLLVKLRFWQASPEALSLFEAALQNIVIAQLAVLDVVDQFDHLPHFRVSSIGGGQYYSLQKLCDNYAYRPEAIIVFYSHRSVR